MCLYVLLGEGAILEGVKTDHSTSSLIAEVICRKLHMYMYTLRIMHTIRTLNTHLLMKNLNIEKQIEQKFKHTNLTSNHTYT